MTQAPTQYREQAYRRAIARARADLSSATSLEEQVEAHARLNALLSCREDVWSEKYGAKVQKGTR